MKRIWIYLLCLVSFLSCNDNYEGIKGQSYIHENVKPVLPDSIIDILKDGDIILRRGDGPLSFHLSRSTGEPYTHCGIIFKAKDKWGVIHTLGSDASEKEIDGVQTTTLSRFVKQAADSVLFICRPIFKNNAGDLVLDRAKYYLQQKVPFDHRFSLLTTDKFYCSELLYYVFKDANEGKNIFVIQKKRKSYILMFSTFFKSQNFEKIYELKKF